jgi:CRISPR-associated endonuclease/helicase Cas3
VRVPWGKSDSNGCDFHHLAHHCADVAAVFEAIISCSIIRPRLEKVAGRPLSTTLWTRLAVLCFLHDVGKLHPGFQAKGWDSGEWNRPHAAHVQAGAALYLCSELQAIAEQLSKKELIAWGMAEPDLLLAVLSHHGRPFEAGNYGARDWNTVHTREGVYDPVTAATEMGRMLRLWFPAAFGLDSEAVPTNPEFQHLFSGVVALADWIGSDRRFFPFVRMLDTSYIDHARKQADLAVRAIGIDASGFSTAAHERQEFSQITGFPIPNAQQQVVGSLPLDDQLVILEAETGSGKTEAAIWRYIRLMAAGCVDSLYFALPTRSAAIQLHRRVNNMLKNCWNGFAPEAILSVPGYLKSGEAEGIALPDWKVRWDDDGIAAEEILTSRWAAEGTKRYLTATVAVGTVDQAMLATLAVKHAHMRSAALCRSFLVIDEVHASDAYMTEIQNALVKTHLRRGGYAMLMSATLGSRARTKWLDLAPPQFELAVVTPYPAVWRKGQTAPSTVSSCATDKPVQIRSVPCMAGAAAARIAIEASQRGARVLVIRNTVNAALQTWKAVQDAGSEDLLLAVAGRRALHHSRFAPEDRRLLDGAVEDALSPNGVRDAGLIVIGTQTLEQSLDIDADLLITDLCPIDVLLQRIGRLHRHRKTTRPAGFGLPVCHVMFPSAGLEPLLKPAVENGLGGRYVNRVWTGIYCDLSVLELTRRLIVEQPVWHLPQMNRLLVESATHESCIEGLHRQLGQKWIDYHNAVSGTGMANRGAARHVILDVQTPFGELRFPTDDEKIRTRLGDEGARIRFTQPVMGPFGVPVSSVTLPSHWSHGIDACEYVSPLRKDDSLIIQVGEQVFRYDCRGLTRGNE